LVVGAVGGDQLSRAAQAEGGKNGGGVGRIGSVQASAGLDTAKVGLRQGVVVNTTVPVASEVVGDELVHGTSVLEEAAGINERVLAGELTGAAERVDSVGEGINGVRVVEGLGAEHLEEGGVTEEG